MPTPRRKGAKRSASEKPSKKQRLEEAQGATPAPEEEPTPTPVEAKGGDEDKAAEAEAPEVAQDGDKKKARKAKVGLDVGVIVADNVAPPALGVECMDLDQQEALVATGRADGSVALHRVVSVDQQRNRVFNFLPLLATGGRSGTAVTALRFVGAEDEFLAVALGSGQVLQLCARTLAALHVVPRAGGCIRSMARLGTDSVVVACADGAARQLTVRDTVSGKGQLTVSAAFPKTAGADRALCVAVADTPQFGGVVVADDARHVTAFELPAADRRGQRQLWHTVLPTGYPLAMAVVGEARTVAVGTSLNEVVFIDAVQGVVASTFQHHKGPVTCLTASMGVVYASGWHEALRAYRIANVPEGTEPGAADFAPAEVKRRTHYHECTALAVGARSQLVLSSSRDGTLMYTNLPKLFTRPASYVDIHPGVRPFACAAPFVTTFRSNRVEVYRVMSHEVCPFASFELTGAFQVRGAWCNQAATRLAVATDDRVVIVALDPTALHNAPRKVAEVPVPGANAVAFLGDRACYIGHGARITTVHCDEGATKANVASLKASLADRKERRKRAREANALPQMPPPPAFHTTESIAAITGSVTGLQVVGAEADAALFVATGWPFAVHWVRIADDTAALRPTASTEAVDCANAAVVGREVVFACPTDNRHYAAQPPQKAKDGKHVEHSKVKTVTDIPLPPTATVLAKAGPAGRYFAAFQNGLFSFIAGTPRWKLCRHADLARAPPLSVKDKYDFAAAVPTAAIAATPRGGAAAMTAAERQEFGALLGADAIPDEEAEKAKGKGAKPDPATTVVLLRRNLDRHLSQLPMTWRVRRFGN